MIVLWFVSCITSPNQRLNIEYALGRLVIGDWWSKFSCLKISFIIIRIIMLYYCQVRWLSASLEIYHICVSMAIKFAIKLLFRCVGDKNSNNSIQKSKYNYIWYFKEHKWWIHSGTAKRVMRIMKQSTKYKTCTDKALLWIVWDVSPTICYAMSAWNKNTSPNRAMLYRWQLKAKLHLHTLSESVINGPHLVSIIMYKTNGL